MNVMSTQHECLKRIAPFLFSRIKGQDSIIERVSSVLLRGELGLCEDDRPKGSFLFVGPTGVGKTELTLSFSEFLFGPDKVIRFDMSEYQNQSSVGILLGQNANERGTLGRELERVSTGTLLFDEIEKAHPLVLDLFLQILDPGRITLATGETKYLNQYYIVFTSNIGAAEAMRMEHVPYSTLERTVTNRVRETLRPELVGRVNELLVFQKLSTEVQKKICDLKIAVELRRLNEKGYELTTSPAVRNFLIRVGYSKYQGARPMRDAIHRHIRGALAAAILKDGKKNGLIDVDTSGKKLVLI